MVTEQAQVPALTACMACCLQHCCAKQPVPATNCKLSNRLSSEQRLALKRRRHVAAMAVDQTLNPLVAAVKPSKTMALTDKATAMREAGVDVRQQAVFPLIIKLAPAHVRATLVDAAPRTPAASGLASRMLLHRRRCRVQAAVLAVHCCHMQKYEPTMLTS